MNSGILDKEQTNILIELYNGRNFTRAYINRSSTKERVKEIHRIRVSKIVASVKVQRSDMNRYFMWESDRLSGRHKNKNKDKNIY